MATATKLPEALSVEAAAARFGIGRSLAYELARRGELPGVIKLGGRYVVSRTKLERALNGEAEDAAGT
jgi:excisionase family DNA binding protein